MSRLLFDSQPLIVDRKLAKLIGLNEAIVLQQINFWIKLNEDSKKTNHYKDKKWWTYNTYPEWIEKDFPFWSESTLIRAIKRLETMEILISTKQYNKKNYDNTKWYTIDYEKLEGLNRRSEDEDKASSQNDQTVQEASSQNDQTLKASSQNDGAPSQNDQTPLVKMTRPIPKTNTKTNTENTTTTTTGHAGGNESQEDMTLDENDLLAEDNPPTTIDLAYARVTTAYQREFGRPLTEFEHQKIGKFYSEIGELLTIEVLREAVDSGIRNFRYMNSIVNEWHKKGIKSMIDLEEDRKKFEQNTNKLKKGQVSPRANTVLEGKYDRDTYND